MSDNLIYYTKDIKINPMPYRYTPVIAYDCGNLGLMEHKDLIYCLTRYPTIINSANLVVCLKDKDGKLIPW